MNALRHGLTGRVVVLPSEDMTAYYAFCDQLMEDLAPEGPLEKQYAQTFCDTQWRLNRIRSIEDSMFSLGHFGEAGHIDPGHSEVHAAFTSARVFRDRSKDFANLSLYEQRLNRTLRESLRQLKELQADRRAAREAALQEAVAERNLRKMKGEPNQAAPVPGPARFVFSKPITESEIETEALRQARSADIQIAKRAGWDLSRYRETTLKQAA